MKRITALCSFLAIAATLVGCATQAPAPSPSILRVGVSPNSRPVIFKQGKQIAGIEADLARKLGHSLNREVVFVELPWNKLIESLESNKIDIIMSNMSITSARSVRVNFSIPYLQSGLTGLFRRDNYDPSGLPASTVRNQTKRIGFVKGKTGEFMVMQRFNRAETKKSYSSSEAAVSALKNNKIDMFIHDAPIIWWLSATDESGLVAFPELLNIEPLAWGIAKNNTELLNKVNALVIEWDQDGTTKRIVDNWLPSFKR
ncbi:transporter substrate-binding domain-containing protein [Pontiella sulfatireligans]|uniref:ABC transporter arginine-binding protein 1 n=1 Tax=Pontiella sulfatireligans TaxID=2750658 RepID=A0A6C2UTP3_9BACT|nr:transporter substrate-binding domain-containing protein [Pontiella sulfatireligans]VGO22604.1 ABC transporter arginine-binding protein 1 [Pontiella sulfatireligans]